MADKGKAMGRDIKESSEYEAALNAFEVAARQSSAALDDLRAAALALGETQWIAP